MNKFLSRRGDIQHWEQAFLAIVRALTSRDLLPAAIVVGTPVCGIELVAECFLDNVIIN